MENLTGQYEVQAASMDQGTLETRDNVRRAEEELTSVRSEVVKVVANWNNTVININKVKRIIYIIDFIHILSFRGTRL